MDGEAAPALPVTRGLLGHRRLGWVLFVAIVSSCHHPTDGDTQSRATASGDFSEESVARQIERLVKVENAAYRQRRLVDGPAAHAFDATATFPLYPYYLAANPRLNELATRVSRGEIEHLIAYVVAPAGFGKSPLVGSLRSQTLKAAVLIDVKKALTNLEAHARRADLEVTQGAKSLTLSELPAWPDGAPWNDLVPFDARVLLVDSLSEVHPLTSQRILDELDRSLRRARETGHSRCVFVFGRAEAFVDRLDPTRHGDHTEVLYLSPPEWRSTGDLENLYRSYTGYRGREFKQGELDTLIALLARRPHLVDCTRSLSMANFLIERGFGPSDADGDIRAAVYGHVLERAHRTHGRPGAGHPQLNLYEDLLRAIVATYARIETREESPEFGSFEVPASETVELETGEKARARDVLDRSGFTEFKALDGGRRRYRLTVLWLQRYLLEQLAQAR